MAVSSKGSGVGWTVGVGMDGWELVRADILMKSGMGWVRSGCDVEVCTVLCDLDDGWMRSINVLRVVSRVVLMA